MYINSIMLCPISARKANDNRHISWVTHAICFISGLTSIEHAMKENNQPVLCGIASIEHAMKENKQADRHLLIKCLKELRNMSFR